MSDPDNYIDDFDEWEVVDVTKNKNYSTDSPKVRPINTKPRPKPSAKKEDVDLLAKQIEKQLSLKNKKDEENLLALQDKINKQQQISEYTLKQIEFKLNQIAQLQHKQNMEQQKTLHKQNVLSQQQLEMNKKLSEQQKNVNNNNNNIPNLNLPPNNGGLFNFPNLFWPNNNIQALNNGINNTSQQPILTSPNNQPGLNINQQQQSQISQSNQHNVNNVSNNNKNNEFIDDEDEFDINIWQCPNCNENNDESNKFCPKCGCKNDLLIGSIFDENQEKEEKTIEEQPNKNCDVSKLKFVNIIGETVFIVGEKREIGWILKNKDYKTKYVCTLSCLNKNKTTGLKIIKQPKYEFTLKKNEEIYILMEMIAPIIPGKYTLFFDLRNNNNNKISDILELNIDVKPKFDKKKEKMILDIIKMGFDDRIKIENALKKYKWNLQSAVNNLL